MTPMGSSPAGVGRFQRPMSHAENTNTFIKEVREVWYRTEFCTRCGVCLRGLIIQPDLILQALQSLEYPEKLQRLLLTPQREVLVELVITKDNGEIETFNAYRVQHDDSRGPFKGGLRYHPQVDLDDVRRCVPSCYACKVPLSAPKMPAIFQQHC